MHSNLIYGSLDPQVCPKTASRSVHPFCRDHGCGFCDKCRKRAYGTHRQTDHVTLITTYHIYHQCPVLHTHTHTHTRLTALFQRLPGRASTRKAKPTWILPKQERVSGSGISWATCKSAPCSRQITTPAPNYSAFYRPDGLPAAQPTVSKH